MKPELTVSYVKLILDMAWYTMYMYVVIYIL